jgi:polyisoprenoid-binding protein YceI
MRLVNLGCLAAVGMAAVMAQDKAIDAGRSSITVHVGKTGLFSMAGHEHLVSAPISAGVLAESGRPHVEFRVDAARMEVQPDPKIDARTQAEIQKDMQEITLESAKYPEIVFRSTRVEKQAGERWMVEGTLTLHGVTKQLALAVMRSGDGFVSHATIKQTDFGIKPISAAGGAVKVKNELEIDFRIVTRPGLN